MCQCSQPAEHSKSMGRTVLFLLALLQCILGASSFQSQRAAWVVGWPRALKTSTAPARAVPGLAVRRRAVDSDVTSTSEDMEVAAQDEDIDEMTRKWGLEGGLLKSAQQGNFDKAKELLKKYGVAYLATSISFAIVSFAICYRLVDSGVDMGSLLAKVGITVDTGSTGETAGTATIAYIVHKAASPIRTVPVVALTPVVAKWMGKEPVEDEEPGTTEGGGN